MFNNIYNERLNKIGKLIKNNNYGDVIYCLEQWYETYFTKVDDAMVFLNNIKTDKIKLEEKKLEEDFN